jgi:peptide/nickel transport system permease protein
VSQLLAVAASWRPRLLLSWPRNWRPGRRHTSTLLGCSLVLLLIVAALAAPLLSPYSPLTADPTQVLRPPTGRHWFGTDKSGMDIYTRVLYAARLDLVIASAGTALALAVGVPCGLLAGFYRGYAVEGLMRLTELVQSFPLVLMAMAFVTLTGQREINIVLAIAILNAPIFLRLVRASVLAIRGRTFVEAAICAGNPDSRLLVRHILPNVIGGSLAQASVTIGWAILLTAGLSFVSIGVRVPTPEWGSMVSVGAPNMTTGEWWVALFPGLAIVVAVLGFNLLGDGLQDLVEVR